MAVRTMTKDFDHDAYRERREQPEGAYLFEYEGAVLDTVEENHYDDSDFFAIVWDEEKQAVTRTQYATTRGWTYPNGATVDATDEVRAKARDWYRERALERAIRKDREEAEEVKVGRKVRVTKARTRGKRPVAEGTEGWVAALVPSYGNYRVTFYGDRVNVPDAVLQVGDQLVYFPSDRLAVIDPEYTDEAELRDRIWRSTEDASKVNYRGFFHVAWLL